jgi:hypothetical protein
VASRHFDSELAVNPGLMGQRPAHFRYPQVITRFGGLDEDMDVLIQGTS